jgi:hypothetical protein
MIYLVIDTNNWIYLANSKNPDTNSFEDGRHIKLLELLAEQIETGEVELLLCTIIEDEWKRNKAKAEGLIEKYNNELNSYKGTLKRWSELLEDPDKAILKEIHSKCAQKIELKIELNKEHIAKIEELITKAQKYEIGKGTFAFAAEWALNKKAPFIGDKKNSMADALIFFGAVEYLKGVAVYTLPWDEDGGEKVYPVSIFVSGNKGDFSNPDNADEMHNDLKPIAEEIQINFFRSLPVALNFIQEKLDAQPVFSEEELTAMQREIDDISDDWYTCDVCSPGPENEYTNMVHFSDPYEVQVLKDDVPNQNQLRIEFEGDELLPPVRSTENEKLMVRTGDCTRCGMTHVLCEQCETVIPLDVDNEEGFVCEGCGIKYVIRSIHQPHGGLLTEILADLRTEEDEIDEV